jgi:diguanylate cyclase (GGDEF)-like protein
VKSVPRRVIDTGWLWRGPIVVAALILVVTSVVALVQQREAVRRRNLVFEAQGDQLRQEILEAIDREGEEFRSAVAFVAATHPGPVSQFRSYFDSHLVPASTRNESSYAFMLVEQVPIDEFGLLEERERRLGNPSFAIRSLAAGDGERLILTRTVVDAPEGELDVIGLDVTGFESQLPVAVPDSGYALRVLEPGPTLRFLLQLAGDDTVDDDIEFLSTFVILVSPVPGVGGETSMDGRLASAIRFVSIDDLLDRVDRRLVDGIRASLLVDGVDEPVLALAGEGLDAGDPVDLRVDYGLATDGQQWNLVVSAGPGYGPATGLFAASRGTWAFGLTTAALAALTLLFRAWHGRRAVRAEQELASALTVASTDGLTGLLNRVGFVQQSGGLNESEPATVLFIDLDGFKAINDLDGHEAGDVVLREVAARLARSTRPGDLVSRLGGDEFIIYVEGADEEVASRLSSRIIDTIDQVDERLSCSVGVAMRRAGEVTAVDELLRRADSAMYKVKRSGGRGFHLVRGGLGSTPVAPGALAADAGGVGRSDGVAAVPAPTEDVFRD